MATDTPVVATNTGSVKEIIDGAGIVVNSECNLPKALNKVISNRKKYIDKIDIERFRIHNVMPKFEKLYESVMSS
jgi:glycosyltransferase involved in cell wall biosynthesis